MGEEGDGVEDKNKGSVGCLFAPLVPVLSFLVLPGQLAQICGDNVDKHLQNTVTNMPE